MNYHIPPYAWKRIFSFLRTFPAIRSQDEAPTRLFVEGVHSVLRSAAANGAFFRTTMAAGVRYKRFFAWLQKGIWNGLFENMGKDLDEECVRVDDTIVRTHACAAGYVKAAMENALLVVICGGFAMKIRAKVDALGKLMRFILTKGRHHDVAQAEDLLQGSHPKSVLADKDCDYQMHGPVV